MWLFTSSRDVEPHRVQRARRIRKEVETRSNCGQASHASNNLRCLGVAETPKLIVLRRLIENSGAFENPSAQ